MDFSDFKLEDHEIVICEPCFVIVLFANVSLKEKNPPDLLNPYRVFVADHGETVNYCRTDGDQMKATRIEPADLQAWPNWMSDPKRRSRGEYGVELRTGKTRDEWRTPSLEADHSNIGAPHTYYRISLPLTWLETARVNGVTSYLQRLLDGFPLLSGYAGYSFAWNASRPSVEDATQPFFQRWLQRFPGILCPNHLTQAHVSYLGLTDLGWITLLGSEYTARLDGIRGLRKALADVSDAAIEEVNEKSAQIRIGDAPRLGDIESGDTMSDYRSVGRVLSSLRDRACLHENLVVPGLPSRQFPEERARWIDRFFPQ